MQMLNQALGLVEAGWAVFPCRPRDKHPITPNGFKDATRDPEQVRAWWQANPHANIGLPIPDGCAVIDVDPRNGGDLSNLPPLPETLTVETGGGGLHVWVRLDPNLVLPGKLGPGIDTRNAGRHYVIAPGSVHESGKLYAWKKTNAIAPAPQWLVERARSRVTAESVEVDFDDDPNISSRTQPQEAIEQLAANVAPYYIEGQRHDLAKNLGGWLKQRGWTYADVAAVIQRLTPCTRNVLDAAKWAYTSGAAPFGWLELRNMLGERTADALDYVAPNPKKEADEAFEAAVKPVIEEAVRRQLRPPELRQGGITARMRALQNQGPPIPTGVDPIDRSIRGGLREEKILVLGGAPGAGKTSLMRQMADNMARDGVAVGWLACDEEPNGIDIRRAQAIGISREQAEQPTDAIIDRVAVALAPLPFEIFDVADGWTVETMAQALADMYPNSRRCVYVDSIQTARTATSDGLEPRARIDNVISAIKQITRADTTRCAAVTTSELARGAYRSEANADAMNDLAAFKESGAIEYQGHVLIVLRSIPGHDSVISATEPKNRLGNKLNFLLEFNRDTTNFVETFDDPRERIAEEKISSAEPVVFQKIREAPWPGLSWDTLKKSGLRHEVAREAVKRLVQEGKVIAAEVKPAGGTRKITHWRTADTHEPKVDENHIANVYGAMGAGNGNEQRSMGA